MAMYEIIQILFCEAETITRFLNVHLRMCFIALIILVYTAMMYNCRCLCQGTHGEDRTICGAGSLLLQL